jgi:SAM-dependent methyltransferase
MDFKKIIKPVVHFKRAIDRQLYAINISLKNSVGSFRQWISITRRINSADLTTGTSNSTSRDQWVEQVLSEIPAQSKLLDAGAGEQKYRRYCTHLDYVSQDNTEYDGHGDGHGGHVESWSYGATDYICDIANIPAETASFDAILCTEVLEHLPDPIAAITELARLLRPGGILLLTAPFCSFTHFSPHFYSTGFSRNWYLYHLNALGFTEIELIPNGNFFEYVAQELRRIPIACSNYSQHYCSWRSRLAILTLLSFLQRCSLCDTGSSEYACYGWHVKAVKSGISTQDKS